MKAWSSIRHRPAPLAPPLRRLLLVLLLALPAPHARADDGVTVPGGPASVRRLLGLDPERPSATFFLDLHEFLLFGAPEEATWSQVDVRRRAVAFVEDLTEWRRLFGNPARFAPVPATEWTQCERALEWLGYRVSRDGSSFSAERLGDEKSKRRQSLLDAMGTPTVDFLGALHTGQTVTVACADEAAPLPFGLAAWRETISDPGLTAENAFLFFVKNVRASRMLAALHGLDPETRDALPGLVRDAKGRPAGWKILYEEALEPFARYPEALLIADGGFVLPGGAEADAIWTSTLGVSPSEHAAFLRALFKTDGGKAAYVVDTLWHLREETARQLLFGTGSGGPDAVGRFRRLYEAIESFGASYASTHRDPFDFAHLAWFLRLSPEEEATTPAIGPNETAFPRTEAEVGSVVSREKGPAPAAEESLRRILRGDSRAKADGLAAGSRFVFLSSLLADYPTLADPGLQVLLSRGFDRFLAAYAILEDLSFVRSELARRYLFTLDRLDRRGVSRDAEVSAGLFECDVELLAQMSRSRALRPAEAEDLFAALLDVPLFAREDATPTAGEAALFRWLTERLLPVLRAGEGRKADEAADSDELIQRALVGPAPVARVSWRGGFYRFDPAGDEVSRRRAFREKQRLASVSDLEHLHQERDAAMDAAEKSDLAAAQAATAEFARDLGLEEEASRPIDASDERITGEEKRAGAAAADVAALPNAGRLAKFPGRLAALDAVVAERHLEALLGHVYAASAGDPNDLYYQDPFFVRRHSFRTVAVGGSAVQTAFTRTALVQERGSGARIAGSIFDLTDVLGLLHADQLTYRAGARVPSDVLRSGLVAPIRRMSVARLDDDSLEVVEASCTAARELAGALAGSVPRERFAVWFGLARDLVPRSRLWLLALLDGEPTEEALSRGLSPSDQYRIGRRLLGRAAAGLAPLPAALRAREAIARLVRNHGEIGSRERLAEFGPLAKAYAERFRLTDMEMPPYERLAAYRRPEILSDRLYDLKIAVACRVAEARLPAAVLPIVLPEALDAMLTTLKMAHPYDWSATTRVAAAFSRGDLDRIVDDAVRAGRLVRDDAPDDGGSGS